MLCGTKSTVLKLRNCASSQVNVLHVLEFADSREVVDVMFDDSVGLAVQEMSI